MLKLIKYEFIKTKTMLVLGLSSVLLIELFFVAGCIFEDLFLLGIFLFLMLTGFGMLAIIVYSVMQYNMDIGKKQGYMVFLTPHSAYEIIGAKLIASLIVSVVAFLIYCGLVVINYNIIVSSSNSIINDNYIQELIKFIDEGVDAKNVMNIMFVLFTKLLQWFANVVTIYFAITLVNTFLSNVKGKGIIAIIVFVIINSVSSALAMIPAVIYNKNIINLNISVNHIQEINDINISVIYPILISTIIINFILGISLYFITAKIADKKLSL